MNKTAVFQVFDEDPGKDGKLGEVRVDKFADQLKEELPKSSESENKLYAKVWKAENYGLEPVSGSK